MVACHHPVQIHKQTRIDQTYTPATTGARVTYRLRIVSSAVQGSVPLAAPCIRLIGKAATTPVLVLGGPEGPCVQEGSLEQTFAVNAVDVGELHSVDLGCESRTV